MGLGYGLPAGGRACRPRRRAPPSGLRDNRRLKAGGVGAAVHGTAGPAPELAREPDSESVAHGHRRQRDSDGIIMPGRGAYLA